jgi:hypothetical protein
MICRLQLVQCSEFWLENMIYVCLEDDQKIFLIMSNYNLKTNYNIWPDSKVLEDQQ